MPSVFTDESGTYDLTITTPADWTVSSGGMPNGDNYVTGDGSIAETSNVNGDDFHIGDGTAWSIELWYYQASATTTGQVLFGVFEAGSGTSGSACWYVNVTTGEQMQLVIGNTAAGGVWMASTSIVLTMATWYHIAFVKDAGASISLYINGALSSTTTSTSGTVRTPTSGARLYMGTDGAGNFDFGQSSSGGRLSKVAIDNVALTPDDITKDYVAMMAAV